MSDNWEMYFTNVDDEPAAMLVDLGIADEVPDPERPMLLWMWLHLKSPTEEGFASDEEEPRLVEIEDSFIAAIELTTGATLVGRITTCGRREFYFYAKSSAGFQDSVDEAMEAFADDGYEYETGEHEDEDWAHYTDVLYPEPENMQEIFNLRVIEQLSESGDPLTSSRTVDHFANFANEADREAFAVAAAAAEFTQRSVSHSGEDEEELPYGITLQRDHAVDWDTIDEMSFTLFELAAEHNGQYEGWGSPVVVSK